MIASTGNARVRAVTALAKKAKARREQGVFLVEGPKMFGELPVERRREVYVSENFLRQQGEKAEKLLAGCRYETVTDEVMRHMSDTQTPQGILAVAEQFSYQLSDVLKNSPDGKAPELVILETLQDRSMIQQTRYTLSTQFFVFHDFEEFYMVKNQVSLQSNKQIHTSLFQISVDRISLLLHNELLRPRKLQ